jgi:hypothetical protein
MIFVLDTAVGLGVWLPFTFGKSTALLTVSWLRRRHSPYLFLRSSIQGVHCECSIGLYVSYVS